MPSPFMPSPERPSTLGQQETDLLRFVAAQTHPVTVGEAETGFGDPANLSRSTIKTVLERLCRKGYLERVRRETGVWAYRSPIGETELLGSLVHRFVERTLAGSLDPFVAYFVRTGRGKLSPTELAELERLVLKLQPDAPADLAESAEPIP